VTRLRKCAVWRLVVAISAHPPEQERRDESGSADERLQRDQPIDGPVVCTRDRARGVQRDVRGERREDPQAGDRVSRRQALAGRQPHLVQRPAGDEGRAARAQVPDQPALLPELCPDGLSARGGQVHLVVVAVHRRGLAAVEQRSRALIEQRADVGGVCLLANAREQDLPQVPLRERPLARGDLEHRRLVLRAGGRPDRQRDADRREERKGDQDRGDGATAARGEGPERRAGRHRQLATRRVRMPPR
jgi:hypothetical protein